MKRLNTTLFLLLFAVLAASAQTALSKYKPGTTSEGATYFLPKTAVRVQVLVEKTTCQPGDFCKYAQRYLRLNDVAQEPTVSYRVVSLVQEPVAVADTSKAFSVKYDPRTSACNVVLSYDGTLLAINTTPTAQSESATFTPSPKAELPNPRQFMSDEILAAGSSAKMAELTALEIYDIRENRNLLIKGQADFMPKDGLQLQIMLDQLDLQDRALTSLFQGVTTRDTTEHVFIVSADAPLDRHVFFRLSQRLGVVDADDLSGTPYYINIENLHSVAPPQAVPGKKEKKVESGIYVNIPGRLRSTILSGVDVVTSMEMPAPQFGNVELLSGALFNKRYTTHLILNPLTGAVERLDAELPK